MEDNRRSESHGRLPLFESLYTIYLVQLLHGQTQSPANFSGTATH